MAAGRLPSQTTGRSAAYVVPMADADHLHHQLAVNQVAHDAIVAHAVMPRMSVTARRLARFARLALRDDVFQESDDPALYGPSSLDSRFSAAAVNLTAQAKALLYLLERRRAAPALPSVQDSLIVSDILEILRQSSTHHRRLGLPSTFGVLFQGRFQFRCELEFQHRKVGATIGNDTKFIIRPLWVPHNCVVP